MFFMESSAGSNGHLDKWKRTKTRTSISAVFTSCWNMVRNFIRKKRRYRASFTIEATFVLGVVMVCVCGLIRYAYETHDTVTGTMILEEVLLQAQRIEDVDGVVERSEQYRLEAYGEELGNPRLWLGPYNLDLQLNDGTIKGKADAGEWSQEMEMGRFRPGDTLLNFEVLKELEKEWKNDGSGIQAGDEPELYGDTSGDIRE